MAPFVHDFEHGQQGRHICWEQGANLADDQRRPPVPPGFTIDTDVCGIVPTAESPHPESLAADRG